MTWSTTSKMKNQDGEQRPYANQCSPGLQLENLDHMKISLKELKFATKNFHHGLKIGCGGYGNVYKADLYDVNVPIHVRENGIEGLSENDGLDYEKRKRTVAIKRLNLDGKSGQGTDQFWQEISILQNVRHQNVVKLVGFCYEEHECILVYEHASNGSLDNYICSNDNSTGIYRWARYLKICRDVACGLEFLHNQVGESHRIIHRDMKSANILLTQNWEGKISDFGLSLVGPAKVPASFMGTPVAGTLQYIDPQYGMTGMLTKESDVYSFGVVLLEVLTGRLAYFKRNDSTEFLTDMAKRCFDQKKVNEIIDPKLKKEFKDAGNSIVDDETCPDSIKIFASIAKQCLQANRADRPTMAVVLKELERALKSHVKGVEVLRTSLDVIRYATNNFGHVIKQGVSVNVYHGELAHSEGHSAVIVKRLNDGAKLYGQEFCETIQRLYSYRDKNVIPLFRFCEEATERIVVFERMVNGSLKEHVNNTMLRWKQRVKISVDAACGLAYIHGCHGNQQLGHGGIKSSNILLNHEWEAVISDLIIAKGQYTSNSHDSVPNATTSIQMQKLDVYSFGVILYEILSGRSLQIETSKEAQRRPLRDAPIQEHQNCETGTIGDGQLNLLARLAARCFEHKRVEEIVFPHIKKETEKKSLDIFYTIAKQCLQEKLEDRPTMAEVVKELEKALENQDEWEWEQKLPMDYEEIIKMSKDPVTKKKDIYSLLSTGLLLPEQNMWFSISTNGLKNNIVSATTFSSNNDSSLKRRPVGKSRFSKVVKVSDISNLNIKIKMTAQFLTPDITYGAYLVFKFCNRRKVSSQPLYVNLKYKMAGKTLNAYLAQWKDGTEWLRVELFRFPSNYKGITDVEVQLENFSKYYCGNGGIFIEGIEFQAIPSVNCKEKNELKDETKMRVGSNSELDMELGGKESIEYLEIIKRSDSTVQNTPKEKLYFLLRHGILIDNGEKLFSLSKVNAKKCHMLPANTVIYGPSNAKSCKRKPPIKCRCRFSEVVKILSHDEVHIKCRIETQMLSSDATYACFLVFSLLEKCDGLKCPVKALDLLSYDKEGTKIISFTTQSEVNLDKIQWIPNEREDGWMEVKVWETIYNNGHSDEFIQMDLKLICFEGTMYGLIIYGVEFRPT